MEKGRRHPGLEHIPADIHGIEADEVLDLLGTDIVNGLTPDGALQRLDRYGPNEITRRPGIGTCRRFLRQFRQPLVYILLIAAVIVIGLGKWVDASVILGVVLVNAAVGFIQEHKAEKAISELVRLVPAQATVKRGGSLLRIDARNLVPGDMVLLESGDRVPADLRLIRLKELRVDESMLTGESVPAAKHSGRLPLGSILADRRNIAYAGTLVVSGQAEGVVWATGDRTESGRIAGLISAADSLETPLTRKIAGFSRLMLRVILGLAAATLGIGMIRGEAPAEMFMAAVTLAVSAIPEGLPATVTICLAIGVVRLARRRAIIRHLPAVETLGSTTVICSDKTGTLTENRMTVRELFAGGRLYEVGGSGYEPEGEIHREGSAVPPGGDPALGECLKAGLLCNDANLVKKEGRWEVQGDPTEAALIVAARKWGLDAAKDVGMARLDVLAFESARQYMATLHHDGRNGARVIYKKGAVEHLLPKCVDALAPDGEAGPLDRDRVMDAAEQMAEKGLRVLAFARRLVPADHHSLSHDHVAGALTFLGLQAMEDPPREDAIQAVARCRGAGISVKMITGDHALTATSIARRFGIGGERAVVISGRQLEKIPDEELPAAVAATSVFARVTPEQKVRLVKALQSAGHVVAMTGDGVNDAPALRQADIGVAMGITGTDVAKGAADLVLTDDNFATIEKAVEEGRGIYDNLVKCIVWAIPCNFGESLTLLAAIFTGVALPALPVQLLWVNMMTAAVLGFALVFEPKEEDLMSRPPRDPAKPIMDFPLFMRTGLISLMILAGSFGLFVWVQAVRGLSLAEARTVAVNVIVVIEVSYLLSCRSLIRPPWALGMFSNPWIFFSIAAMVAMQVVFTYLPVMNRLFGSAALDALSWLHVFLTGAIAFAAVEFEKWLRSRSEDRVSHHGGAASPIPVSPKNP